MNEMKSIDFKILTKLIENSRLSDRQLSRSLGASQPTITRRRRMIEKRRLLEYTAVPDLRKLGFEILAFTFARLKSQKCPDERMEDDKSFVAKHPCTLFVSTGRGLGSDRVAVSAHKNYADFHEFMQELKNGWGEYMENIEAFIVSLESDTILRNLSFKYLADLMRQNATRSG